MSVAGLCVVFIPATDILHSPAYEDGTDSEFRNVGSWNSDAGELPKKEQITFRTWRKLKNKNNTKRCLYENSLFFYDRV